MNKFQIGFIGCGRVTQSLHLPALQNLAKASVVAVADIDSTCSHNVAKFHKIPLYYNNYHDLLNNQEINVVVICVPPESHRQIAIDSIEAKKHTLIEKPLALTLEDCDDIIACAKKNERKVGVGFNLRHHVLIQKAKQILNENKLGTIRAIKSHWGTQFGLSKDVPMWRKELPNASVWEIAVHHFDLWRLFSNSKIKEIRGMKNNRITNIMGRTQNNVVLSGFFSEASNICNTLEIYGDHGRLIVSLYRFDGLEFYAVDHFSESISSRIFRLCQTLQQIPKGFLEMKKGGNYKISYFHQWQNFLACIENNTDPQASLDDGRYATQIAIATTESLKTEQTIFIE